MESHLKGRVLVTGASGFVGKAIVNSLSGDYDVLAFDISHVDYGYFGGEYPKIYTGDITQPEDLEHAISGYKPTHIIHLAAIHYIPYCNRYPTKTFDVNVMGTYTLLKALVKTGGYKNIKSVFIASTAGVYTPSLLPHRESDPTWPNDIYGFSKLGTEMIARSFSEKMGIPVVIGRYFNMYGWGETTPHLIPVIMRQVLRGDTEIQFGNAETRRDYVDVRDNAEATKYLLDKCTRGITVVNLGSGISYNALEILEFLESILERPLVYKPDSKKIRPSDRPNLVADISNALKLGIPRPEYDLYSGLEDLCRRKSGIGPYVLWDLE